MAGPSELSDEKKSPMCGWADVLSILCLCTLSALMALLVGTTMMTYHERERAHDQLSHEIATLHEELMVEREAHNSLLRWVGQIDRDMKQDRRVQAATVGAAHHE